MGKKATAEQPSPTRLQRIYQKHREIILYIIVGVMTTIVYFITRRLVLGFGGGAFMQQMAVFAAHAAAIAFAFVTNKLIVFRSKTKGMKAFMKQLAVFVSARVTAPLAIDSLITYFCIIAGGPFFINLFGFEKLAESRLFNVGFIDRFLASDDFTKPEMMNTMFFALIAQVLILIVNYITSKMFVFKKAKESTDENAEASAGEKK